MQNDWILDVLSDLRAFADANGMAHLSEQLDTTRLVAACELASANGGAPATVRADDAQGGAHFGRAGARFSA